MADDVLRLRLMSRSLTAVSVVAAVGLAAVSPLPAAAAYLAMGALQVVLWMRLVTVLTPSGLTGGRLRRRTVPWGEVRAVRASPYLPRVDALLADGGALPLPGVEWRAVRTEGQASPNAAQRVVEWARAHGHDVELVEA